MDKQNNWTYCSESTKAHPVLRRFPACLTNLSDLCRRDGGRKNPFDDQVCIDVDGVEVLLAKTEKRSRQKTVDLSFVLKDGRRKITALVEIRLNYSNIKNLSKSELDSKLKYSKVLLGNTPPIQNHLYCVFKPNLKNQAYSKLRRLYSNKNVISGIDLDDLMKIFFS